MLFQRRDFLRSTVGAIAGAALPMANPSVTRAAQQTLPEWRNNYERTLAASMDGELLGSPHSRSCIHQGLHPFSPERTLILPNHSNDDGYGCQDTEIGSFARRIMEDVSQDGTKCTVDGICQVTQAASALTQTYGIPNELEAWSTKMAIWLYRFYWFAAQDHVWISPMGWQGDGDTARTMNDVVDWWLILIPNGIEVWNIDGTRTYVLITPVFSRFAVHGNISCWKTMSRVLGVPGKVFFRVHPTNPIWLQVSRMDRMAACLALNERIAGNLTKNS